MRTVRVLQRREPDEGVHAARSARAGCALQHRTDRRRPGCRPGREGEGAADVPVGPRAELGERPLDRVSHDQRPRRDAQREAELPGCVQKTAVPDPRRRVLRVARREGAQTAVLHPHEVGETVRVRRSLGTLEQGRGRFNYLYYNYNFTK